MTGPDPARPSGTAPFLPAQWWALPVLRRRQIAGAVAVAIALVLVAVVWMLAGGGEDGTAAAVETDAEATVDTDAEADAFVAALPSERVATWDRLAQCESGGDWSADSGNGFYGGLQFTLESWAAVGGTGSPAANSRDEQIMRAERLYDDQGWGAWPNCSATLGLT